MMLQAIEVQTRDDERHPIMVEPRDNGMLTHMVLLRQGEDVIAVTPEYVHCLIGALRLMYAAHSAQCAENLARQHPELVVLDQGEMA